MGLISEDGMRMPAGTKAGILEGVEDEPGCRLSISGTGSIVAVWPESVQSSNDGEWSAKECLTLLDAVRPGDPFRQLGVYANMRGGLQKAA